MQRAVQSSPRSIDVKSLPKSNQYKNVSAIGTFDHASFSLHQTKGNVGEGITATMIIQGDGNLEVTKAPELQLPQGLHCYEGNSTIERINDEKSRKKFEWIIQADSAGHFSIDAQTFTYFDPSSQSYKTLTTNQSILKIIDNGTLKKAIEQNKPEEKNDTKNQAYAFKPDEISCVNTNDNLAAQTLSHTNSLLSNILTWLILLIGFLATVIATLWTLASYFGSSIRHSYWINNLRYRYLFYLCTRQKNLQRLHQLFIALAKEYNIKLQGAEIAECFTQLNLPKEAFDTWQQFLQRMLTVNFAGKKTSTKEIDEIFAQASGWFSILLSCCKLQKTSYPDKSIIS